MTKVLTQIQQNGILDGFDGCLRRSWSCFIFHSWLDYSFPRCILDLLWWPSRFGLFLDSGQISSLAVTKKKQHFFIASCRFHFHVCMYSLKWSFFAAKKKKLSPNVRAATRIRARILFLRASTKTRNYFFSYPHPDTWGLSVFTAQNMNFFSPAMRVASYTWLFSA